MGKNIKFGNKQFKLTVGFALLLLIVLGGVVFFVFRFEGGANNIKQTGRGTIVTPTPTTSITPTSTQQPLFFDDFSNNKNGWYTNSVPGYIREVKNRELTLSATNHKVLTESLPTNNTFYDSAITASSIIVPPYNHDI